MISTSVHVHAEALISTHRVHSTERGYLRITPDPDRVMPSAAVHADAAGFRRLAAACLDMADELDKVKV